MNRIASQSIMIAFSVLYLSLTAKAGPIIHGEFDYDIEANRVEAWQIGPVLYPDDKTELELPVGQSEGEWELLPELKRELCNGDSCSVKMGIGANIPFSERSVQPFVKLEAEIDF
jgi:hypothetical protein